MGLLSRGQEVKLVNLKKKSANRRIAYHPTTI